MKVKPCFSRAGQNLGTGIPALIGYERDEPVMIYPHQLGNGSFRTIREYIDSL